MKCEFKSEHVKYEVTGQPGRDLLQGFGKLGLKPSGQQQGLEISVKDWYLKSCEPMGEIIQTEDSQQQQAPGAAERKKASLTGD